MFLVAISFVLYSILGSAQSHWNNFRTVALVLMLMLMLCASYEYGNGFKFICLFFKDETRQ